MKIIAVVTHVILSPESKSISIEDMHPEMVEAIEYTTYFNDWDTECFFPIPADEAEKYFKEEFERILNKLHPLKKAYLGIPAEKCFGQHITEKDLQK